MKCKIIRTVSFDAIRNACESHMWYDAASLDEYIEFLLGIAKRKHLDEDAFIELAKSIIEHSVDLDDSDLKYVAEAVFALAAERLEFYDESECGDHERKETCETD